MLNGYRLVDLTMTLDEACPVNLPTHIPFRKNLWNWYVQEEDYSGVHRPGRYGPYFTEWLMLDEHCGTHFDAPTHFIPHPDSHLPNAAPVGSRYGELTRLEDMFGKAAVIDATAFAALGKPGAGAAIPLQTVRDWEQENGAISPEDIVMFATGWDKYCTPGSIEFNIGPENGTTPGSPGLAPETMQYLIDKGVKCVCIDTPSMDPTGTSATHFLGLTSGMIYIETLTGLTKLPKRGAYFIFLPLKVKGSSGCPGRAIALLPDAK